MFIDLNNFFFRNLIHSILGVVLCSVAFSSTLFSVEIREKIQAHMRCLELSGRTEEVWDINENDKSTKDHFLLLKGIIEQFVKKEGIAGFEEIDYKLFPKFLKEMESFPHNIKDLITLNWADLHCDDNNDMAREYARNLVKTILESPHLTTAQYVNVLSRYTTMTAYSDAAISLLKKAQKRSDLTRDQRFFVDAKLAYYDALNNGPKYLQKLIKDYPDKRQCVGIAGEQIALRYRSSVNAPQDAKEKALECYTTVMKLCPEMYNEASSLLGYTTTCREGGKPKIVLDYLRRYIDAHPKEPDTLEVLLTLAYIYHDDLEEYETAVQIWDELVEFDVPESLLTDYLKEIKQRAKTNRKTALSFAQSGRKKNEHFELPSQVFWTTSRIILMTLNGIFILSFVLFCLWNWTHPRNNFNKK